VDALLRTQTGSSNEELDEMTRYVFDTHGKHIRPSLCILSFLACGGKDSRDAVAAGAAIEIIHNASLIHDDINDGGTMRRGRRTLHKEYSITKAIVAGDFLLAQGFSILGSSSPAVVDSIVKAASGMAESEFMQDSVERSVDVSEDEYMEIITGKTAMLMMASVSIGASLAGADPKVHDSLVAYTEAVGKAFQIIDDTLDVVGNAELTGKRVGLDILEGKPTLPLILAIRDPKRGPRIKEVFSSPEPSMEDVCEVLALIVETGAVERCKEIASKMVDDAVHYLDVLEASAYKDAFLALSRHMVERDR